MAVFRIEDGPDSDDFEFDTFSVAYSMSWPSSGPSEDEVPMSSLMCQPAHEDEDPRQHEQPRADDHAAPQAKPCRNPLPSTGTRRDAAGGWSAGSEGHDEGLCAGPCKDLRSGRGCTYGKKCKLCHLPHPDVSSTSIRKKKSKMKKLAEQFRDAGGFELTQEEQMQWFLQGGHDIDPRQLEAFTGAPGTSSGGASSSQARSSTSLSL
eukprot:TRINITY_DN1477_c0_g1_i2.p1 TRINITY_DN1477_c0_g1~~TRINITY_DN1477_c0_g1_i2.p1  ORF type:complete len:207 (-),score=21.24 TRINITY_DN1477_c0_g1_i2:113-733(-)